VPPLGTQGHIWQLIFAHGLVGTFLFLLFFVLALSRCWRCRTTTETLCTFILAFFGLLLVIYDTLGIPLMTVMIAVGLVAREQRGQDRTVPGLTLRTATARLRERWPVMVALVLLGALLGAGVAARDEVQHASRVSILLAPSPVSLQVADETEDGSPAPPTEVTIDTEAALLVSRESLSRVVGSTDAPELNELRDRIRVTAVPSTRVLEIEVRNTSAARAAKEASSLARSYLVTRRGFLSNRRDQALSQLRGQLAKVRVTPGRTSVADLTRQRLERALTTILLTPTTAGEVIATRPATTMRRQAEVPVTSGAALGFATSTVLFGAFPGWRPVRLGGRRRRRGA
jgi:hypothetical protein